MAQLKTLIDTVPRFWRDGSLPFMEVRSLVDGRATSDDRHAHQTLSIVAVCR